MTTIPVVDVDGLEKLTVQPSWPGSSGATRLTIDALKIGRRAGLRPLVHDEAGRVLAAAATVGSGMVGLSLLSETYRWVLEGHSGEHASYWSYLVSALARPIRDADAWRLPGSPILVDRPQELTLDTERPEPRVSWVSPDGIDEPLATIEDPAAPGRWRVIVRPTRPGWFTLKVDGEASASFRASPAHTWRAWQQAERLQATRNRAVVETPALAGDSESADLVRRLPRGFAYLLLIVSAAFLWASDRWGG